MKTTQKLLLYAALLVSSCISYSSSAQDQPPCNGKPLPDACKTSCDPTACYAKVLKDHYVNPDTFKKYYITDGGPFPYADLSGFTQIANCEPELYFIIAPIGNAEDDLWNSIFTTDTPQTPTLARGFPVALIKAIDAKYGEDILSYNFYWLKKSMQCPFGDDVAIDVVLANGTHDYYDLSDPPTRMTLSEQRAIAKLDLKKNAKPLPHAIGGQLSKR